MSKLKEIAQRTQDMMSSDVIKKVFKYKSVIFMIIYHLCPIDVVPDVFPFVGQLDEVFITIWSMCNLVLGTQEEVPNYVSTSQENAKTTQIVNGIVQVADRVKQSLAETSKMEQVQMLEVEMPNIHPNVQNISVEIQDVQEKVSMVEIQNDQVGMYMETVQNGQTEVQEFETKTMWQVEEPQINAEPEVSEESSRDDVVDEENIAITFNGKSFNLDL